jgi:hypothetical protein
MSTFCALPIDVIAFIAVLLDANGLGAMRRVCMRVRTACFRPPVLARWNMFNNARKKIITFMHTAKESCSWWPRFGYGTYPYDFHFNAAELTDDIKKYAGS